ncbi:uncharacterized protein LOC135809887 [Sycon ciliatum]|uniref:uncharacterized protein LOC135809887 n=1 Tax=Sycon ciliatum TaxID=27933 RepID=UPI0031F6A269
MLYSYLFTTLALVVMLERVAAVPSVDCKSQPQAGYDFCNTELTPEKRATDLVGRLTLDELIQQTWTIAPAIDRLGIKDYNWRSNCLHGWAASGGHWEEDQKWTVFPTPIALAATFDLDLVEKVAAVTSDEGRALHNMNLERNNGSSVEAAGLNCFSPNVNLYRDPRWGRGMETFGEDPYLVAQVGLYYTLGLQQEAANPHYLKVVACPKHYVVHSGPDQDRAHFTANTTLHDFYDTYAVSFKTQIMAGHAGQVMPAYSGVYTKGSEDGAPDCANKFILKKVLREEFGGHNVSVCSDNGGVAMVYATHHYVQTAEEAAAVSMNATTDLDLGHDAIYSKNLGKAVTDGLVAKSTIEDSVWRNMYWRMRLGDFDPESMVPYQQIDKTHLNTNASQKLNIKAARESIVLLKNDAKLLPLSTTAHRFAVIGPNIDAAKTQMGNYEGNAEDQVSILDGIKNFLEADESHAEVADVAGCKDTSCTDESQFKEAVSAVLQSDVVIMVLGLSGHQEGEGHDRSKINCGSTDIDVLDLPGCQLTLLEFVIKTAKPVILVLMNGGPLSIPWAKDHVHAIMEVWYPGALGGTAVAEAIFGKFSPSGRMPVMTVTSSAELPNATDYSMTAAPGRTYKYYTGEPLFPFGFGLTYSTINYTTIVVSPTSVAACKPVEVTVGIMNSGHRNVTEVIQVYVAPPRGLSKAFQPPLWSLRGFKRVPVAPGAKATATFSLSALDLSVVDENGIDTVYPGVYVIYGSPHAPTPATKADMQQMTLTITGTAPTPVSQCSGAPRCIGCKATF